MIFWFKSLFCRHHFTFVRNIYGDEINIHNGKRSIWKCEKCGWWEPRSEYVGKPNATQGASDAHE